MPRFLTPDEVSLIHRLLPETTELSERLLRDLALAQVEDVEVVGFGAVVFLSSTTQVFGSDIATAMLADADGVPVRVTLCLDNHDQLFELELCKVDFSPIIGVDLRSAFSEH
ncbi:hypothetical protein ABW45_05670 [Stenotrophomonas maltophilia]|nr:hypothetical protein [Stenotrophomonas pavanii]KOQ78630.1 hypothetical protein ABW45_05670 [Stenotrophomonas maltophilia]